MAAMACLASPATQALSLSGAALTKNGKATPSKTSFLGELCLRMVPASEVVPSLGRPQNSAVIMARCIPGGGRMEGRRFRGDIRPRAGNMLSPWGPIFAGAVPQRGTKSSPVSDVYWLLNELMRELPSGTNRGSAWDIEEDNDAWHLRFELPGYSAKDVRVQVEGENVLSIVAQKATAAEPSEKEGRFQSRRSRGGFSTRLTLPEAVQVENISAEVKHGVLVVTLPKIVPEEKLPRVISVNVRESSEETEGPGGVQDVLNEAGEKKIGDGSGKSEGL